MSTIASPRESSVPAGRRLPLITTPSSSARPSFDSPRDHRSTSASPSRGSSTQLPPPARRNRAALREYYNIKAQEAKANTADDARSIVSESEFSVNDHDLSDVLESEMDREGFDADAFVKRCLEGQTLEELMRTYNSVLTDIRALDAEKKALVYDNYSKLIAATETIRKMRANMEGPMNPMARTLDPAIAGIYERAEAVKRELKAGLGGDAEDMAETSPKANEGSESRRRAARKARELSEVPEKVRRLVRDGQELEASDLWEETREVLLKLKDSGKGGADVDDCIADGDAALKGELPGERSWVNIKSKG